MRVLGISAFYHDSAAVLVVDGRVVAAAQEERFSRKKHDARFPRHAAAYCLRQQGLTLADVDRIAFYDKPLLKFERLLETYLSFAPRGWRSFVAAMPVWLKEKLFLEKLLRDEFDRVADDMGAPPWTGPFLFPEHHYSHAASAFYPSPFEEAAVLTMDGVGEWATTSFGVGSGSSLTLRGDITFPHSLGLLYSAFTYYTGFKVNSGEYKVMGLAPYGEPKYVDAILTHLIDLKDDGSFRLNMDYFDYCTGLQMTNDRFHRLFGGEPRKPESPLTQREMDLARSIQYVTELAVLKIARHVRKETGMKHLCMAGGVALNCVANGKLLREKVFDRLWIQPAAGDAGGALGAALAAYHGHAGGARRPADGPDGMEGSYLGPAVTSDEVEVFLKRQGYPYERLTDQALFDATADLLAKESVIGWVQDRMEFGPRALGNRSIIGDARSPKMQSVMNLKIKYRESFRPFAPAVLEERAADYFELDEPSPYMLLVAPVKKTRCVPVSDEDRSLFGIERLNRPRSDIPAVTHLDYSARIQTVSKRTNPRFHALLTAFATRTGYGVLVNTSFNVRGEPIVCTPEDAYRCFMRTEMDALVLGNCLLRKDVQPKLTADSDWKAEFQLD
ncbi:MAG: carbamoyltransferase [Alphaproteobacteria bacterium]|nr:carbamoyltransferase [Alphaproteobacteria bacterium]